MKYNNRIVNELRAILGNLHANRDVLVSWDTQYAAILEEMKVTTSEQQYSDVPGVFYAVTSASGRSTEVVDVARRLLTSVQDNDLRHAYNRAFQYCNAFTDGCERGVIDVVSNLLRRVEKRPKYHRSVRVQA